MPVIKIDFDMVGFDRVVEVETKPSPAFVVFADLNKSTPMVQFMFGLASGGCECEGYVTVKGRQGLG